MTLFDAVVLGLVEGITEYLPVSSTGHLILASSLLGLTEDEGSKRAVDAFNVVIQGGAILAVLGLYWKRVVQMLRGLIGKDAAGLKLASHLIVAFIPAAALGKLLHDTIKEELFSPGPVVAALAVGGVWMLLLDRRDRRLAAAGHEESGLTIETMTWKHALGVGLFQVVAMWPGTSRSMMTIAGGTMLGLRRKEAAEFSFLLGLPTLGAACVYDLYKDWSHARETGGATMFETLGMTSVIVGMLVAALSAAVAVRWLVSFLTRHGLGVFGWYRIALAIVMGALLWGGVVTL
ncbi:MAG: undecaprenyl-diphosphate phosphatase [Phycisphaerales bacterium]